MRIHSVICSLGNRVSAQCGYSLGECTPHSKRPNSVAGRLSNGTVHTKLLDVPGSSCADWRWRCCASCSTQPPWRAVTPRFGTCYAIGLGYQAYTSQSNYWPIGMAHCCWRKLNMALHACRAQASPCASPDDAAGCAVCDMAVCMAGSEEHKTALRRTSSWKSS